VKNKGLGKTSTNCSLGPDGPCATVAAQVGLHVAFIYCLLFGALNSPTDPIAVLGILRRAGVPRDVETKITGESLFNDGIGVVVFIALLDVVKTGHGPTLWDPILLFLKETFGGALFGTGAGYLAYRLLKQVGQYQVEILLTLALVARGYALADCAASFRFHRHRRGRPAHRQSRPGLRDVYAAKWHQTSNTNGGSASLSWIRLGHASDEEIEALVDGGIGFSDIFDVCNTDPGDVSYKEVKTYMGTEWLRLKSGMEKAAAFLETRRHAALLGATTEFSKMEGVTHNARDKKTYVVISRVEGGMTDISTDPQNDIRLARNDGGAIYELSLAGGQKDTDGHSIASGYVAKSMASIPELLGGWLGGAKDAEGNRCLQDKVCGGDNLKYAENMRTLFIGEDTSRRNNNYVWAFNIDTRRLSRILSVPMYAEATGLQVVENQNGYSYIMSNFQHPGEQDQNGEFLGAPGITEADVLDAIDTRWDNRKKAAIGDIGTEDGALPRSSKR
jgi:hypothetical protein